MSFTVPFSELTVELAGHRYTWAIDGEADILDWHDRSSPAVEAIRLLTDADYANKRAPTELPKMSPLWSELANAIMQSCKRQIAEGFDASRPDETWSYHQEHALTYRQVA